MCVLGLGVHSSLCPHRHGLTEAGKALENHGIQALTTTPALVSTAPGSTSTLDAGSFLLLAPGNPHLGCVGFLFSPLGYFGVLSSCCSPLQPCRAAHTPQTQRGFHTESEFIWALSYAALIVFYDL